MADTTDPASNVVEPTWKPVPLWTPEGEKGPKIREKLDPGTLIVRGRICRWQTVARPDGTSERIAVPVEGRKPVKVDVPQREPTIRCPRRTATKRGERGPYPPPDGAKVLRIVPMPVKVSGPSEAFTVTFDPVVRMAWPKSKKEAKREQAAVDAARGKNPPVKADDRRVTVTAVYGPTETSLSAIRKAQTAIIRKARKAERIPKKRDSASAIPAPALGNGEPLDGRPVKGLSRLPVKHRTVEDELRRIGKQRRAVKA